MGAMFIGFGTVANVVTVAVGALLGLLLGNRIGERTRTTITDVLGMVTVVLGVQSALAVSSDALHAEVGSAGVLAVLGSLLLGAMTGSALRLEDRLEGVADALRRRLRVRDEASRFVDAVVTPTLLFCVGPLTILGSLSDGLGRGADQLLVKAVLDGFASIAFASTLGWGVLLSALALGVLQGSLTLAGFLFGDLFSLGQIDALSATGGVILIGLGLRLMRVKTTPIGDLLPALAFAPLIVWVVSVLL